MSAVLASIPSPSTGVYHLGPFTLHMYGVMLLLAIGGALWLTGVRWVRFGGDWDLVFRVAIYGVVAGIIGARIYHDLTSWNQDAAIHAHWYGPFAVWSGGLGIWGAIPFGKHTTLPWGLKIDAARAPNGVAGTYHPTFLYEFLWDTLGVLLLVWIDRRFKLKRPGLFALYVAYYCAFRMFEETLRIDPSSHIGGMRLNFWVSLACFVGSVGFFAWWQFLRSPKAAAPKAKGRRPVPQGPRMSVPKGRVR